MKPILEIQSVSKRFNIHHSGGSYLSLRDRLAEFTQLKFQKKSRKDFWALKDVSFDVAQGETVGIIGKNGAGKSTLLKILSKITPPTKGKIICRGRIASLLEVGTGFHPELTGRENIFFNGSVLGMKKKEILIKFDEIIDFAGTEKFLDTPLKHYSSGMQLRLAFAVAAFLEPEILVIDEVLAVGDVEFQKKCIRKMEDVSRSGRTILFVSHNMTALEGLCTRGILLENGQLSLDDKINKVIHKYLSLSDLQELTSSGSIIVNSDNAVKPLRRIELRCDGRISSTLYMGCQFEIRVFFKSQEMLDAPVLGVILRDSQGIPIIGINNKNYHGLSFFKPAQEGYISMSIPYLSIFEGFYHLDIHFGNSFLDLEVINDCIQFMVEPKHFSNGGELPSKKLNRIFIKDVKWAIETK